MTESAPRRDRNITDKDLDAIVERLQGLHQCRLPEISNDDIHDMKDFLEILRDVKRTISKVATAFILAIIAMVVYLSYGHGFWKPK